MEQPKFNILYYSNKCKHSAHVIEFIAKNGFSKDLECICIDKRVLQGSIWVIQLENGTTHKLPPNIDRVPTLLLVKDKYQVKFGDDIMEYFKPQVKSQTDEATLGNGEPLPADNFQSSPFAVTWGKASAAEAAYP